MYSIQVLSILQVTHYCPNTIPLFEYKFPVCVIILSIINTAKKKIKIPYSWSQKIFSDILNMSLFRLKKGGIMLKSNKTKNGIWILLIILFSLLISGCMATDSDYVIRVTANPGLEYNGSYMVVTSGGQSISKSVDGIGGGPDKPIEYSVKGNIVSVAFQKKGEQGTLIVEILKNEKVVASSSTQAAYGGLILRKNNS